MTDPVESPVPIVIDCDPGIDDAVALLLACASPELRLLGVSTVAGNVDLEHTTRNAGRILALAGRSDVPVAAGAGRPLVRTSPGRAEHVHGDDGVHRAELPEPAAEPDPRPAIDLLADAIGGSADPVTLVAIGPLTNVALLYAVHPEVAATLGRVVIMGGSATGRQHHRGGRVQRLVRPGGGVPGAHRPRARPRRCRPRWSGST